MPSALQLHTGHRRSAPAQPFFGGAGLTLARTHEFCGIARRTLAMMLADRMEGPVFWISPAWAAERLHAEGMVRFADPARFSFFAPHRAEDLLWVMEEALRAGNVPLVIADIPAPPALTPVRRLHLAAEAGAVRTRRHPLGVLLTGQAGGAPGVENRWRLDPAHRPGVPGWLLTRQRARTEPPKSWRLSPGKDGFTTSPETPAAPARADR